MFKQHHVVLEKDDEMCQPVVPIIPTYHDTVQTVAYYYTTDQNGNRVKQEEDQKQKHVRRVVRMKLPLNCTPQMWSRYNYSIEDVVDTVNPYPPIVLWRLAVMLGIPLSNSSVKLVFSTPTSMVFASKSIVMTKITLKLAEHYQFQPQSILDKQHPDHVPPMPISRVPTAHYQEWRAHTFPNKKSIRMTQLNYVARVFTWQGITIVPLYMEDNSIFCMRVITEDEFEACGRVSCSMATKPIRFSCQNITYCALVDEAVMMLPE